MKNLNAPEHWLAWLRACLKDTDSPIDLPHGSKGNPTAVLGMLTGQDMRALTAIAACWALYAGSDETGARAAITAIRALLAGMQPKCLMFARELIAQQLDWSDRRLLWPRVAPPEEP
jgi:hypothetical protein